MPRPRPDLADEQAAARLAGLTPGNGAGGWVPDQPELPPSGPAVRPPGPAPADPSRGRRAAAVPAAWADRLPVWLRAATTTANGPALLALAAVCALCVTVTAVVLLRAKSQPAATPAAFAPLPAPSATASAAAGSLVVDVGGHVRRPGLVTLPAGARVADAVHAAGGALRRRDLARVNLAARVTDGQLLLVGVPGGTAAATAAGASPAPVDLNAATAEQLDGLPGIGPVLAQRIIDWRSAHGGFRRVEDLQEVSGIGDSTYADLAPLVTVG